MASKRERKRVVNEGVRRLLATPEWNPYLHREARAADRVREAAGTADRDRAYAAAKDCADCAAEQARTGDPTALCPAHLAEALGL